MNSEHICNRV